MRAIGRGLRSALGLALCGCALAAGAVAATPRPVAAAGAWQGEPLIAALERLQDLGLRIVFTSELVRPEMRVPTEPTSREPRQILDQILAPHGLLAREGPGGVLVVAGGDGRAGPAIAGEVLARGSREPIAEATVRLVGDPRPAAAVGPDGGFTVTGPTAGRVTVEAAASGYLEQQVEVDLSAGEVRRVTFLLRPQPYVEDEIVVRPSQLALLQEEPDSSFAFGREEIESLPHLGGDLFRAASLLPGVTANDVSAQFSVHGGRRDEVKVLLDGQELYSSFHLPDYDNALSIVPAPTLGGAELLTGVYPAMHGDRMSGVLDLRTLEPPADRRYVLSLGVLDLLASASGRAGDGGSGWLLTGRRGSLDLAGRAIGDEDPRFWDAFGRADTAVGRGRLTGRVLVATDDLALDQTEEDGFETLANDYRSTYGWLTHRTGGRRLLVESSASWSEVRTRRGTEGREEEGGFLLSDRRDLEIAGLTQAWTLATSPDGPAADHLPRWGWEARRYRVDLDYDKALEPEIVVQAPFSPPRPEVHRFAGRLESDHLGVWVSDRFSALDRLTAEIGARYDRHTLTDDTLFSPRVNLAWRLGERSVVRAAWGRFYQSQRPYELQVEDAESRLFPAELSAHSTLGYETLLPRNRLGVDSLRVELFHRDIRDPRPRYESLLEPLNFSPEVEPDRARIAPDRSTAQGVELLLRGRRGTRFDWWLAYSYSTVEDRIDGRPVPRSLDQPHSISIDLAFRLPHRWRLNLAWRYHSGWPTTPVEGRLVADPEEPGEEPELVPVFGALNSDRLPAYHRLDLRASRPWQLSRGTLSFYVDVQNLYDRRNLAGFDVDVDDDAGVVRLDEESWPGFFPSAGVTWKF